jgi:hypothetical protein
MQEIEPLTQAKAEATLRFIRLWVLPRFQTPVIKEIELVGGWQGWEGGSLEFKLNGEYYLCADTAGYLFSAPEIMNLYREIEYGGDNFDKYKRIRRLKHSRPPAADHILKFSADMRFQIDYMYARGTIDVYDPTFIKDEQDVTPLFGRIILLSE